MLTGWQIEEIAAVDGIDVLFVGRSIWATISDTQ